MLLYHGPAHYETELIYIQTMKRHQSTLELALLIRRKKIENLVLFFHLAQTQDDLQLHS